jgi:excisionase family DNA binding protein
MSENQEAMLFRVEEVAKLLSISRSGVYRLFKENQLKPVYVNQRTVRVSKSEVDRFVDSLGQANVS